MRDNFTYRVKLHLANDSDLKNTMLALANNAESEEALEEEIKEYIEEHNPYENQSNLYTDLITGALQEIDYNELAHFFWQRRQSR